ncbi:MAG: HlyC/CorC family transporter [Magnetococcales bacterium]|nr:HlyC/CorC family transporter [Magnetococcales bacterium]
MEILIQLLVILIFLILKGFFSGSEIAMVNCDKIKMRHKAKMGDKGASLVLKLFKTPDVILGTTLVGTNIATVTITTLATLMFINLFGAQGDLISVLIFTPFLLILGEIVPKSVYQQKADFMAPYIIYGLRFFSIIFFPVIFIFSRVARIATKLVGGGTVNQSGFITREEIRMLLEMSENSSSSITRGFDKTRIRRIIRFADTTVGEAMIPLAEVAGLDETTLMGDAMDFVWSKGFNRLPIYKDNITNVIGVLTLNTWDLMDVELANKPISEFVQEPLYISPKQTIDQTLPTMQHRLDHMGIVVDEFGSAIGILTMEDVFEEVVGEIDVGYDFDEYHPKRNKTVMEQEGEDEYVVDGRTPMSQINDTLHTHFKLGDAHTVAGLILNRLRTIPKEGASIVEQDYKFTVRQANSRTISKVHIQRV